MAEGKSIINVVALVCGSTRRTVNNGESLPRLGSIISHFWSDRFFRIASSVVINVLRVQTLDPSSRAHEKSSGWPTDGVHLRAGCKERDVANNRNGGPVKSNIMVRQRDRNVRSHSARIFRSSCSVTNTLPFRGGFGFPGS